MDYGRRRIGIAVGEAEYALFSARKNLQASGVILEDAKAISLLARKESADCIVVGIPDGMESETASAKGARLLFDELKKLGETVALADESLTTVEADRRLRDDGLKAAARKKRIDSESAIEILKRFVEEHVPQT